MFIEWHLYMSYGNKILEWNITDQKKNIRVEYDVVTVDRYEVSVIALLRVKVFHISLE